MYRPAHGVAWRHHGTASSSNPSSTNWRTQPPGIRSNIVVHVVEITIGPKGAVKVDRVVSAVDCGMVVNPDGLRAQIEGAILFGLTAALKGEIGIDKGAVVQSNFNDYEMLRLADCPEIEIHIREDDGPVGGGGEPGVPPVAPALANAIFAATGVRIRELPVKKHSLSRQDKA